MSLYKYLIEERRKKRKLKYNMTAVNGGFSDGVEIIPGDGEQLNLSIDIYGGTQKNIHSYKLPEEIYELRKAYNIAVKSGDPTAPEIKEKLDAYYDEVKRVVSVEIVKLLKIFDDKAQRVIDSAINTVNSKY